MPLAVDGTVLDKTFEFKFDLRTVFALIPLAVDGKIVGTTFEGTLDTVDDG